MLQTAAHNPALRAVVSEGAGSRSFKESLVTPGLGKWLAGPYGITTMLATAVFSNGMPPDKLHDLVDDIAPRPVFLIFATKGQGGENTLNDQYYAHAGQPKELWEIPDAKHVGGLEAHPVEYERRVVGFFGRALLPRGSP